MQGEGRSEGGLGISLRAPALRSLYSFIELDAAGQGVEQTVEKGAWRTGGERWEISLRCEGGAAVLCRPPLRLISCEQ